MGRPHPLLSKNTELGSPPLVPELKLHLATDAAELWRMTAKELKDNSFAFNIDPRKVAVFTSKAIRINLKANKQDRVETPINFDEQNISEATVWQIVPYHRLHYIFSYYQMTLQYLPRHSGSIN